MIPGIVASGSGPMPVFDPLTQVTALHAGWASDPLWSNPGDGNGVVSWRNQSGGGDPAQGTAGNRPLYRASTAAFGNRPTVEYISSNSLQVDVADVAMPYKFLVIASMTANDQRFMGLGGTASEGFGSSSGGAWAMVGGTSRTGGTRDSSPHAVRATFTTVGNSTMLVDGATVINQTQASAPVRYLAVGCATNFGAPARYLTGHIAFWGVYDGATSDSDLATLETALRSYYGI